MDTQRLSQTVQPLLDWYRGHARVLPWRADREPYHVWLSEITPQQTRVEAVRGYYARFLAAAPDVFALAALPETQLLKLWEGLGYYNRARKAQECAREIAARGGVWPDTVEGLLALPGIRRIRPGPSPRSALSARLPPWTATCCACARACSTTRRPSTTPRTRRHSPRR